MRRARRDHEDVARAKATRACLLIADISGYTRYLAGAELEHAQDILADLLDVVVTETGGMFELAKIEGDAVFCFAPDTDDVTAARLVTLLDACYAAFARRRDTIARLSSCTCRACASVPSLDLKFVVHDGELVVHIVARRQELAGPDVILATAC